jgi:hypothetical protein
VLALERGGAQEVETVDLLPPIGLPDLDWEKVRELLPGGIGKVFFMMATFSTWKTGRDIKPGLGAIAARCRMAPRAVRRCIARLIKLGLIRQVKPSTNLYPAEYIIPIVKSRRPGAAGARAGEGSSSPARAAVPRKCGSCGDTGKVVVSVDPTRRDPRVWGPCGCTRRPRR